MLETSQFPGEENAREVRSTLRVVVLLYLPQSFSHPNLPNPGYSSGSSHIPSPQTCATLVNFNLMANVFNACAYVYSLAHDRAEVCVRHFVCLRQRKLEKLER